MITIPEMVEKLILAAPLLEEGLTAEIMNLSALARQLQPRIEAALHKPASEAAVMMALKRLQPKLARRAQKEKARVRQMSDLIVRSNLEEFTFRNSETILEKQRRLLADIERDRETFFTYTQGVFEVMIIASSTLAEKLIKAFRGERLLSRLTDLSAIVIRLSPRTVQVPGVYYAILKQLAWENLNVIDVVSTYMEFTVVLHKDQVDRAFSVLKNFLWS